MRTNPWYQNWRLTFFQGLMFAVFLVFAIRMYDLQVARYTTYKEAADENRLSVQGIAATRGIIYDRNNVLLANNAAAYIVEITPAELPSDTAGRFAIYNRISALTGVPATKNNELRTGVFIRSIERIIEEVEGIEPYRPIAVAADIDRAAAIRILEERLSLPGVNISTVGVREYPTGALTSHIIGYLGPVGAEEAESLRQLGFDPRFERVGYAGIEAYMENVLAGQRGSITREVDVVGQVQRELQVIPATAGKNLRLTIDVELQAIAERALTAKIDQLNQASLQNGGGIVSQRGVVIAINPSTGEVLAMVSYPSYDNQRFARAIDGTYYLQVLNDPLNPLLNKAISSLFPPGSGWKLITAAAVLEEDVIEPLTTLYDPGDLIVENRYAPNDPARAQRFVCHNRRGHGSVDIVGAISNSCNVYFYQVGGGNPAVSESRLRSGGLGIRNLVRYAQAIGIGTELGIELVGELAGRMPDPDWKRRVYGENWSTGDTYNAAFGQGYINITPLQFVFSVQALITGQLYQPTLVREILDEAGNPIRPFRPILARTVNLETADPNEPITLLQQEDMIIRGENSLACTCEPDSPFYNPIRCANPVQYASEYRSVVDIDPDPFVEDLREYKVHIPYGYPFNGRVCDSLRFDANYTPAFYSSENLEWVKQGMRAAVVTGTAQAANLPYVAVAGKTGTAEYCDNIAFSLGQCEYGNWPDHAWFTAYAPYDASGQTPPEILITAFVYNGGEGSLNALPVVIETLEGYYRLKNQRQGVQPASER
jgi:penicillin-binding protein 2